MQACRFNFLTDRKLCLKFIGCPLQCIVSYKPPNKQQQEYLIQAYFETFAFFKQRNKKGLKCVPLETFFVFFCSEEKLRDILINLHRSSRKVCYLFGV